MSEPIITESAELSLLRQRLADEIERNRKMWNVLAWLKNEHAYALPETTLKAIREALV